MLCKNCGATIKEGDSFCHNCGSMIMAAHATDAAPLNTQPAPAGTISAPPATPQSPQAPQAPQPPISSAPQAANAPQFSAPQQNAPYGAPPTAPYQPNAPEAAPRDNSGFSVAALILGIIGVIPCCCAVNFIPAVLALIFGIISRKSSKSSMAIAGMVLGAIGIVIAITIFFAYIYLLFTGEAVYQNGMYF